MRGSRLDDVGTGAAGRRPAWPAAGAAVALLLVGCPPAEPRPAVAPPDLARAAPVVDMAPPPAPGVRLAPGGRRFDAELQGLRVAAVCGPGALPPGLDAKVVAAHCAITRERIATLRDRWVVKVQAFFADRVPAQAPRSVVYPFAGQDLVTVLAVMPDVDEVTTVALEPGGDPRALEALDGAQLAESLAVVRSEIEKLIFSSYSDTGIMIRNARNGRLPSVLSLSLAALELHGLEPRSLRYLRVEPDGSLHYLDDADLADAGDPRTTPPLQRNRRFGSFELVFGRPGDPRVRVLRHLQANIDDKHLAEEPGVLLHLASKGPVSAIVKAASFLLGMDEFSRIRGYLAEHAVWMVSDATGLPPRPAKAAGFTQETYGRFSRASLPNGNEVAKDFAALFESQPARPLPFRFGYPDIEGRANLIVTSKIR